MSIRYLPKRWSHWHVLLGNSLRMRNLRTRVFRGLKIRVFSDRQATITQFVQPSEPDELAFFREFSIKRRPSPKLAESTFRPSDDLRRRRQIRDRLPGDSIRVPRGVGLIASRFKGSDFWCGNPHSGPRGFRFLEISSVT